MLKLNLNVDISPFCHAINNEEGDGWFGYNNTFPTYTEWEEL